MSIASTDAQIVYRPFTGYDDPRLPRAFWVGVGSVEGDASGGQRTVQLNFKEAAPGLVTEAYSLEQLTVVSLETTNRALEVQTGNMDFIPGLPSDAIWLARLTLEAGETQSIMQQGDLKLPAFLGQPRLQTAAAFLLFNAPNVNLVTLIVHAQGYKWDGGALLHPGGPQRPPTGIYGT